MKLNRRSLLAASATAGLVGNPSFAASEKSGFSVEPRGRRGIFKRLPDLNMESYHDFLRGVRAWTYYSGGNTIARGTIIGTIAARVAEIIKAHDIDPDRERNMDLDKVLQLLTTDPTINVYGRTWLDGQYFKFITLRDLFHAHADEYFTEMEENDKVGPGALELNPTMFIPDYTKHEIHGQLGGYVGDPFAGYIYLYDVLISNDGRDEQDAGFLNIANACPTPEDGKVRRILDMGTGSGQLATSYQRRFPEAEVWGIDVGGPMVRYAHVRANSIGSKANFAQRLNEENGFPDNYFDIVTSCQVHHEMTAEANRKMIKEIQRSLRPGGVFYPVDTYTANGPPTDIWGRFFKFMIYRWNHEDWMMEYGNMDFNGELRKAGFKVDEKGPSARFTSTRPNLMATKV